MKRFRYYFDREINTTHVQKHAVSEEEIEEFFSEITIWTHKRKDDSLESIGKLKSGRHLTAIYRKLSKYDYFIITAFDIEENYIKEFIEKELSKL